jgi:hypothetical protein
MQDQNRHQRSLNEGVGLSTLDGEESPQADMVPVDDITFANQKTFNIIIEERK